MASQPSVRPFNVPRFLRVGSGALESLGTALDELGARRALLVTDTVMGKSEWIPRIADLCDQQGVSARIFDGVDSEPTTFDVEAALGEFDVGYCDSIIGFGGGSALDTAKSAALVATNGGSIVDYEGRDKFAEPGNPVVAIPTTAGTGSEASRYVAITDPVRDVKMLITSDFLQPTAALVDPGPTMTMPAAVTASTGIDALTHAIESYVAKTAHPMSDAMGLSAIAGIARNLARAFAQPNDLRAREAMSVAALQAGIAFSNASVALVHAMARPLGAHFRIPHGISNAMLLETVMSYSISGAPERFAAIGRAMGAPVDGRPDDRAAQAAVDLVGDLCRELKIPSLAQWGIEEASLKSLAPKMAEDAIASGSPANNPRVPSSEEIVEMYHDAYER